MSRRVILGICAALLPAAANAANENYLYPWQHFFGAGMSLASTNTTDAAGEKGSSCVQWYVNGGSGTKTCSAAGGCTISFRTGAVTWASAGTNVDIGIQDPASTVPVVGDETFDVSGSLTQGTDALSANTWTTLAMDTGTYSIVHGSYGCVVNDMTVRNGADSVVINTITQTYDPQFPVFALKTGGSWASNGAFSPMFLITTDDGTLVWGDYTIAISGYAASSSFDSSSNPDEYCTLFTSPSTYMAIDGMWHYGRENTDANASLILYDNTNTSSPSVLSTQAVDFPYERAQGGNNRLRLATLSTPVTVPPSTPLAACYRNTDTAGTSSIGIFTIPSAAARAANPGGTNISGGTRDGASGAFTTSTTTFNLVGVRFRTLENYPRCRDSLRGGGVCY